jgi:hypothetical protein
MSGEKEARMSVASASLITASILRHAISSPMGSTTGSAVVVLKSVRPIA